MENLKMDTLKAFFPRLGQFFRFSKKAREYLPLTSCVPVKGYGL